MKHPLLTITLAAIAAMSTNIVSAQTTWFDRDDLGSGSSYSGICAEAQKGTNTEDYFSYMTHGSKYKTIELSAGHLIRIDAGYVNLDSVIVYMYGSTTYQAPLIASDGMELTPEKVMLNGVNNLKAKWENPGKFVGSITFTVGEKATWAANAANHDKKGEADIYQVHVYASEEFGACGAPMPTDSVTLTNLSTNFTRVGDPEWDDDYEMDLTDNTSGTKIHYPFSLMTADEWNDGDKHYYSPQTDASIKIGSNTYTFDYGYLTVQRNTVDNTKYDFHFDLIASNGTRYFADWTGVLWAANPLYAKEPMTPTTINFVPTQAIYDTWGSAYQIMIYLQKDDDFIQLNFVANKVTEGTIVALGTYPINTEDDYGTVRASEGYKDGYANEECAYYINPVFEEFGGWIPETAYFFQSGTVKVESSAQGIKITVNATSYYGSTITAVYEGPLTDIDDLPTGNDQTPFTSGEGWGETHKVVRNGQLFILHNGNTYTVLGQEIK